MFNERHDVKEKDLRVKEKQHRKMTEKSKITVRWISNICIKFFSNDFNFSISQTLTLFFSFYLKLTRLC